MVMHLLAIIAMLCEYVTSKVWLKLENHPFMYSLFEDDFAVYSFLFYCNVDVNNLLIDLLLGLARR